MDPSKQSLINSIMSTHPVTDRRSASGQTQQTFGQALWNKNQQPVRISDGYKSPNFAYRNSLVDKYNQDAKAELHSSLQRQNKALQDKYNAAVVNPAYTKNEASYASTPEEKRDEYVKALYDLRNNLRSGYLDPEVAAMSTLKGLQSREFSGVAPRLRTPAIQAYLMAKPGFHAASNFLDTRENNLPKELKQQEQEAYDKIMDWSRKRLPISDNNLLAHTTLANNAAYFPANDSITIGRDYRGQGSTVLHEEGHGASANSPNMSALNSLGVNFDRNGGSLQSKIYFANQKDDEKRVKELEDNYMLGRDNGMAARDIAERLDAGTIRNFPGVPDEYKENIENMVRAQAAIAQANAMEYGTSKLSEELAASANGAKIGKKFGFPQQIINRVYNGVPTYIAAGEAPLYATSNRYASWLKELEDLSKDPQGQGKPVPLIDSLNVSDTPVIYEPTELINAREAPALWNKTAHVKYGLTKQASRIGRGHAGSRAIGQVYDQEDSQGGSMVPWLAALLLGGGALGAGYAYRDKLGPVGDLFRADTYKGLLDTFTNKFNNGGMSDLGRNVADVASVYSNIATDKTKLS